MKVVLQFGLLVLTVGAFIFAYWRWTSNSKRKAVYPRGPRKYVTDIYQEQNAVAKLLSDVLALRERTAQWPDILQTLNPQNEPRIRTVLLELRGPHVFVPHTALNIIESVCLSAKRPNDTLSRLDLLELSKSSKERVTQYGS